MSNAEPPALDGEPSWEGERSRVENEQPRRRTPRRVESLLRSFIEWVAVAVGALAVALLVKTFLLQAFFIPSASMDDTLNINDRVLVNKLSYVIGDVDRGDIIVFDKPTQAGGQIPDFIKRVIAMPGETITFVGGEVFIDGQRLREPYLDGATTNPPTAPLDSAGCLNTPTADSCTLGEGWYFVMGDNRGNSTDSRAFGPIQEDTIVGRAFLKVWPLGDLGFL